MKGQGFTLIELMIVVAIIAFLSMISVPAFGRFLAKAKRAEAYMNLHALYMAQKSYWMEHNTYTDQLSGEGSVGWQPEGYSGGGEQEKFCYTYGFASGGEGRSCFTGKLQAPSSALSAAYAGKDSFLIVAAADIDGDGQLDLLAVDHTNNITILNDDLA